MACENCLGLIVISITCFIIALILYRKYEEERNQFTLYMVLFFLLAGAGWLFWFLSTDIVLNIYENVKGFLILVGLIPQLVLLLFVLTFYEINILIRIGITIGVILLTILHVFFPFLRLATIVSTMIIISNIVLFVLNWRKNDDLKSLFFSVGLTLILIGEALIFISRLIQGIFLMITAIIWLITYTSVLEYLKEKYVT